MNITRIDFDVLSGGQSSKVALSVASAKVPAAVLTASQLLTGSNNIKCVLTLDAAGFIRKGANPTAVSDGTDQYIPANTPVHVELLVGEQLACILASGTGNAYFTPNA